MEEGSSSSRQLPLPLSSCALGDDGTQRLIAISGPAGELRYRLGTVGVPRTGRVCRNALRPMTPGVENGSYEVHCILLRRHTRHAGAVLWLCRLDDESLKHGTRGPMRCPFLFSEDSPGGHGRDTDSGPLPLAAFSPCQILLSFPMMSVRGAIPPQSCWQMMERVTL